MVLRVFCTLAGLVFWSTNVAAAETTSLEGAVLNGTPLIDIRYRLENVDISSLSDDATASTLRTRIGYKTSEWNGLTALVEFENIASLGNDKYNSTTNGKAGLPVIADPESTELNRAQLSYSSEAGTFNVGRQRLIFDNARFIGNVGFRQNEQTFDAVHAETKLGSNFRASYTFIDKVHRIFGDDNPNGNFTGDSHLINASFNGSSVGKLTAYGYWIDTRQAPALSTKTFGLRFSGRQDLASAPSLTYLLEYATQSDYANNPFQISNDYLAAEGGVTYAGWNGKLGVESLQGNGTRGFATPLATLHKFQGFADVFLVTPADGIEDIYISFAKTWKTVGPLKNLKVAAWHHWFSTQRGDTALGTEFDALASISLSNIVSTEIKYANFDGNSTRPDVEKIWFSLNIRF